jgi:hypothetical protein
MSKCSNVFKISGSTTLRASKIALLHFQEAKPTSPKDSFSNAGFFSVEMSKNTICPHKNLTIQNESPDFNEQIPVQNLVDFIKKFFVTSSMPVKTNMLPEGRTKAFFMGSSITVTVQSCHMRKYFMIFSFYLNKKSILPSHLKRIAKK